MTTFLSKTQEAVDAAEVPPMKHDFTMLHDMLCSMRPDKSRTEQRFVDKWIAPLGAKPDGGGNMILRIGNAPVMWSCHTDTVHSQGGYAPIAVDEDKGMIEVHPKSGANCLGADDTAGVWVMVNMIQAKRPGLYIFHRGEECGGIGSRWLTQNTPDVVKGIKYAIALDRRGKDSIITHQWGGRCCSETFSKSLAAEMGMGLKSDSGGSFTDTANYTDLIPECTNLSVGYTAQHSRREDLDQNFLGWLLERLLVLDVDKLEVARKAGEKETRTYGRGYGVHSAWDEYTGGFNRAKRHHKGGGGSGKKNTPAPLYRWRHDRVIEESTLALVEDFPEEIAKFLEEGNYDLEFLRRAIRKHGGMIVDTMLTPDDTKTPLH